MFCVGICDFDSDNAPLDLIHPAKTAPPELTTTVVYDWLKWQQ